MAGAEKSGGSGMAAYQQRRSGASLGGGGGISKRILKWRGVAP